MLHAVLLIFQRRRYAVSIDLSELPLSIDAELPDEEPFITAPRQSPALLGSQAVSEPLLRSIY